VQVTGSNSEISKLIECCVQLVECGFLQLDGHLCLKAKHICTAKGASNIKLLDYTSKIPFLRKDRLTVLLYLELMR
jgi:hypothetical protein